MNKRSKIVIRAAKKTDMPQLLELYRELQPLDPPIDNNAASAVWEQAVNSGVMYFVADNNERIVATCYVAIIPNITRQCSPIGFIENILTSVGYRRRGIGRKLLETAVEYAKTQGCYKVTLQSGIKRSEAHKFYESMGFDGNSKRAFEIRF
jgi:GNAT superfamily N-acetyltransferase